MQANVRERIAATQRDRFARMRENAEQLSALKTAHRRMMVLWGMCEAIVRAAAEDGDSLARYVVREIDAASGALTFANIVASDAAADAGARDLSGGPPSVSLSPDAHI